MDVMSICKGDLYGRGMPLMNMKLESTAPIVKVCRSEQSTEPVLNAKRTSAWLLGMLEGIGHRKLFPVTTFVVAFIDCTTRREKIIPVTRVYSMNF